MSPLVLPALLSLAAAAASPEPLSVAEAVCDRISIINRGRVVASGTTAELKKDAALEDVFLELTYDEGSQAG